MTKQSGYLREFLYFLYKPIPESGGGHIKVILRLQAEPELRGRAEETTETKRGISGDLPLLKHDLIDAACWDADVHGKFVLAQVHWFQKLFPKDLAGMYRMQIFLLHIFTS
jgi:hypothetical protein